MKIKMPTADRGVDPTILDRHFRGSKYGKRPNKRQAAAMAAQNKAAAPKDAAAFDALMAEHRELALRFRKTR